MEGFIAALKVMRLGGKAHYSAWEPDTIMYIEGAHFMVKALNREPYDYDLSWYEINEGEWIEVDPTTIHPRMSDHVAA